MSDYFPDWLARLLGIPTASPGEGTLWRLEYTWRLAPWLTVVLCVAGVAYIAFLYRKERLTASRLARASLAALRVAALGIVVWMIAAWTLALQRSGLPHVVVMVDDSGSMATADRYREPALQQAAKKLVGSEATESATRLQLAEHFLTQKKAQALQQLAGQQKLRVYAVSDAARWLEGDTRTVVEQLSQLQATGESSRLGDGVRDVLDDLRGNPPSAIVLVTDGVNTAGESLADAAASARRKGVPLYTVAIGSSLPVKDISLTDLLVNDVVFVNDIAQLEFSVSASGYAGQDATAQLVNAQTGDVLAETPLKLPADGMTERARITYRPSEVGEFEWTVRIAPQADESDSENNAESRTIEVRKDKLRVLMVWWQPSLEFRRIKALLEREASIDLKTVLQDADLEYAEDDRTALRVFPAERDDLFSYDVILFGDANPAFLGATSLRLLEDFVTEKGGGLAVIAGPNFTPRAFVGTPLEKLLPVEVDFASVSMAPATEGFAPRLTDLGAASPGLQLGDNAADTPTLWGKLPAWYWFDPAGKPRAGARVLVEHPSQTSADGSPRALIATQFVGAGKVLYHASDESYRWRFRVGDLYFGRYWVQTIRYLARSKLADESRIAELTADRREYRRGETPRLRVRFADEGRAPVADDGVSLVIERGGQRLQTVNLARSSAERGIFQGALPPLAEGKYRVWISAPSFTGRPPSVDFRVTPPPGETERIAADVGELRRAAEVTGGRFYTLANAGQLWDDLPAGQQVPVETLPPIPLWNQWPPLAVVLALLVMEWVIRKRTGLL